MRSLPAFVLATLVVTAPAHATSGIARESADMFDALLNTTSPTAHMGQRRGVFDGGSAIARTRIMNESLWQFTPPSFEAGCGGIDMFAGSFSYISADQFTALLRSIAANAPGYAFQVAIKAMCETCAETMSGLQKIMQALNQGQVNSCQLAKGIVNDVAAAFGKKQEDEASLIGMIRGFGDAFETRSTTTGRSPVEMVGDNMNDEQRGAANLTGNLVWKALRRQSADDWFGSRDVQVLEAIMSVTGTVIVRAPADAPDGQGRSFPVHALPSLLTVKDLLWGSRQTAGTDGAAQQMMVYQCWPVTDRGENGCLNPRRVELTDVVGLATQVRRVLIGNPGSGGVGLVDKFAAADARPTTAEASFMEHAPSGIAAALRNLARFDVGMARAYAERAAPIIALEMVDTLINDLLRAATAALAAETNAYTKKVVEQIALAREQINAEQAQLAGRYGNAMEMLTYYRDLIETAKGRTAGAL